MKNDNFKWYAFSLTILPLTIGILIGLFIKSTINDKYITALIGLLAAIFAFLGVVYSKEKEKQLKELEFQNKEKEEQEKLFYQKKEEIYITLISYKEKLKNDVIECIAEKDEQKKIKFKIKLRLESSAIIDKLFVYKHLYNISEVAKIDSLDESLKNYLDYVLNNKKLTDKPSSYELLMNSLNDVQQSIAESKNKP